nr:succinate dehydrogenase cytochrome b subunit [Actinomycetales bacterium]
MFLVIHFYGNLKVFQGADAFNNYAHWLKNAFYPFFPETGVLWLMRAVLVPALIIHVTVVAMIWWRGRQSRGKFRAHISGVASWASWLMPLTGILTLVFIIFHVLDLTVGATPAATSSFMAATSESSFAYENLIASFQRPASGIFYMLIMVLLGVHILKGFSNMAADLGAMGKRIRAAFIAVGGIAATLILFGNAAIPAAVLLGVLP